MIRFVFPICLFALASPALAMVGNAPVGTSAIARSVVTIVGSRGNFCSGTLIAPDIVLSAAHCVQPGADYKLVRYDAQRQPQLMTVRRIAIHPQFTMAAIAQNRASADVALIQLSEPLDGNPIAVIGSPLEPLVAGRSFSVAGIGVSRNGDGKSGGVARTAQLVATGQPGRLQIRLVDPATNNTRDGLGACTGDSGGPVYEDRGGSAVIVGVVSWSTGPNNSAGCGGLTGATPLTLYREWIMQTARGWGGRM